jgi:predicted nucleic acid-binding protein
MIATSVVERGLADTNVVIYAYDPTDKQKHDTAKALLRRLSDAGRLVLSVQVLNEFSSVMLRPRGGVTLSIAEVSDAIQWLGATAELVPLTSAMTSMALGAVGRHQLSFWDALIWAAAKESSVPLIYSEDFQHGREIEGVRFVNPFVDESQC